MREPCIAKSIWLYQAFDSIGAMSEGVMLDAVHVVVPPLTHASAVSECLKNGWDVFVEKPFATTVQQCHDIESFAGQAQRVVGVNHNVKTSSFVKPSTLT